MNATVTESKEKRIQDLTLHELDMVYSLSRIGDWSCAEIGKRYSISESDVKRIVDNYVELRESCKKKLSEEALIQASVPVPIAKKQRKRRSDALYAIAKERQAAYRNRLRESRHTAMEQPSPAVDTDTPIPVVEEPPVTVCESPASEIGPETTETEHSPSYGSSEECYGTSENMPDPVTLEARSESEVLQVIEEET